MTSISFEPPYPPYDPTDKKGFSYETVLKRWPTILTKLIDHIHNVNHKTTMEASSSPTWEEPVDEGKRIISEVSKLKYEMARDRPMWQIVDDGEADVETYNNELAKLAEQKRNTWFTAPWLFAECYLYRLIRSLFATTKYWNNHDPFLPGKVDSFKASSAAIYKLAATMHELEVTKADLESDPSKLDVLFNEMIQMCLWGNATDLSLLTNLTHEDILKLQTVGRDAQEERKAFILRDDEKSAFKHLQSLKGARIDFVLDNAGFELFTDLVFADFLVTYTPYVSKVVFHPKAFPWFVSDVTPPDFQAIFAALLSPSFFINPDFPPSTSDVENLANMVHRWQAHLASGAFALSVPPETKLGASKPLLNFWTFAFPYWDMKYKAEELYEWLKGSELVIFKGDLNYRKLTGDVQWPASTPFEQAIGPLAGTFPILSLRTSKADVVVGIDQARADELDAADYSWRFNGKHALISFVPRSS